MPRTLVFDLGAVVLRWEPAHLLLDSLPKRLADLATAQQLAAVFFESFRPGSDWAEFDRGVLGLDEVAQRIAARVGLGEDEVRAVLHGIPAHLQLRADTAALLHDLRLSGCRLVYLSNMPAPYRPHAQAQLDQLGCFETGLYSCDVRMVKPEAEIYREALRRFGATPADCLFFDDSAGNVASAQGEGWAACRFTDAAAARRDLALHGWSPADPASSRGVSEVSP